MLRKLLTKSTGKTFNRAVTNTATPSLNFSSAMITQGLSTHTARIRNSDGQGHGDYLTAFAKMSADELHSELSRIGIQSSEVSLHADGVYDRHKTKNVRYFVPALTHTEYRAEIFLGEQIKSVVAIVGMNKGTGQIVLSSNLKKPTGTASTGYYVLQKYENACIAPLSDDEVEIIKTRLQTVYSASANSYNLPVLTSPTETIGKEIELTDDECRVQKDQTGHNGVVDSKKMFEIAHTYCYEKGLMEGSGEGFEAKKGKPVMSASDIIVYKDLRDGDKYRVYLYAEQNAKGESFEKGKYSWVGTITDDAGNIVAIARCNHALLDMNSKPVKNADQKFLDRLAHYAISQNQGYQNLFDKGLLPKAKYIKLEINGEVATITINVHDKPQNMITAGVLTELKIALDVCAQQNIKVLKLQSGRDGMFVVGADVNEFGHATSEDQIESFSLHAQTIYDLLANNNKMLTVAVINGYALGGGEELALTTDYRIGTPDSILGQVEVLLGVFPAFDGCQRLTDLLGPVEAARQIVSGEMITAAQALEIGLLDAIVITNDDIDAFVGKIAEGQVTQKPKAKLSLSEDDKESLERLKEMIDEVFQNQLTVLNDLVHTQSITLDEFSNIHKWLLGVKNARVVALDVIITQLKTDQPAEKSKIEREAFAKLALTPEAKFATQFWLLEKKKYTKEHEIVNDKLIKQNHFYIPAIKNIAQELAQNHGRLRLGSNRE